MNRIQAVTVGLILTACGAVDATAQWNVARFDRASNRIFTTLGLDPAVVASIGYARVVRVGEHAFQVAGEAAIPAAEVDTRDFRVRLQTQTSLMHWRSVHLTGSMAFITRGTENSIYRGLNFGADLTGTLGLYRPGWFVSGEFGFDKAIITHVTHSDWYRRYFFSGARDGWYLTGGGTFHYGLVGGLAVGSAEIVGRFGLRRTEDFNEVLPPMYASLGLGFGL